jgi:hypothetical protein
LVNHRKAKEKSKSLQKEEEKRISFQDYGDYVVPHYQHKIDQESSAWTKTSWRGKGKTLSKL